MFSRSEVSRSDSETERREAIKNKLLILAAVISFGITTYSQIKDDLPKLKTYKAASSLSVFLSEIKTSAILKKTPIDVRLVSPNTLEVYETTNCGPMGQRTLVWKKSLLDFQKDIYIVSQTWAKAHLNQNNANQIFNFCYDPIYGSSILADGLAEGVIFLAHRSSLSMDRADQIVELHILGANGDTYFR